MPGSVAGPVPIRYIIFPRYDAAAPPRLEPIPSGEAMRELLNNSVNFIKFGAEGMHLLFSLVEGAECFSLTTNGLDETTALIDELTGRHVVSEQVAAL